MDMVSRTFTFDIVARDDAELEETYRDVETLLIPLLQTGHESVETATHVKLYGFCLRRDDPA